MPETRHKTAPRDGSGPISRQLCDLQTIATVVRLIHKIVFEIGGKMPFQQGQKPMFLRASLAAGALFAGMIFSAPSMAQDYDAICLTVQAAAQSGPIAAEDASLDAARITPANIQQLCRAIACGLTDADPEVIDAIIRGVVQAGNEELAACVANLGNLRPAAIPIVPPDQDGSPG